MTDPLIPAIDIATPTQLEGDDVLNLNIGDIEDPRGVCRDISSVGRWGNGNVEVSLTSLDQLPYVTGLIRQAFDLQMGALEA